MSAYLTAIEAALAVLLLTAAVAVGFRFGGMGPRTQLEAFRAEQAELTATAVLAERASAQAESDRLTKVVSDYEKTTLDSVSSGVVRRVFIYASAPGCAVPQAAAGPGGTVSPAPIALGPSGVEQALDAYVRACAADARQLAALIEAWPR